MDRILALVIFLLIPHLSYARSSTVVYPDWVGIDYVKVGLTSTYSASGTANFTGQLITTVPKSPPIIGLSGAAKVFSASASPNLSLARQVAVTAMKSLGPSVAIGIALWALHEKGLSLDGNGQWQKATSPDSVPNPGNNLYPGYYATNSSGAVPNTWTPTKAESCALVGGTPQGPGTGPWGSEACNAQYYLTTGNYYCTGAHMTKQQNGQYACAQPQPVSQPATQADFDDLANNGRPLTIEEARALFDTGFSVPVAMPISKVNDFSNLTAQELQDLTDMGYFQPTPNSIAFPHGDPYTDPVTGEKRQPYVQLDPAPNAGIRVTPYEQTLNPDGSPKLDAGGNPINVPSESEDPCAIDATRAGCAPLGSLDEAAPGPTQTPVSITPQAAWGNAGQCPQDVVLNVMGQSVPFKFSGACQFFQLMNPVVLAAAWVSALFIFIGGVRTES